MDVGLLSIAMNHAHVYQQASISVLKTTMDQAEVGAAGLMEMMAPVDVQALQHEAQPHLGGNIDIKG